MEIEGNLVDIAAREIYFTKVIVQGSRISAIQRLGSVKPNLHFLLPGFVDSHIHIESSMLVPRRVCATVVRHGTVATVSDPHEIANVMGAEGIEFMIADGQRVPFKFCFGRRVVFLPLSLKPLAQRSILLPSASCCSEATSTISLR